ncbi:MAG TPA: family 2B encapsulin nanocompartment shell protein [Pseudonocardiaceae bacterium]|nr:family 2B encapsulin nanocompartment shell protein [Pseudonocardiaceae bacterium]
MTEVQSNVDGGAGQSQLSLGTAAARNLATTTKSVPQMQGISSRWLLKLLPWIDVPGGTFRVNRRLTYTVGDGRVEFVQTGSECRVIPAELGELPALRGYDDADVLSALAGRFQQREFSPGDVLVTEGEQADQVFLLAHGKVNKIGAGKYGEQSVLDTLTGGSYFGEQILSDDDGSTWGFTVKALTSGTLLTLTRGAFQELAEQAESLRAQIVLYQASAAVNANNNGEATIDLASGQQGEYELPGTFVDYDESPREYELSVAQTVLRVHTRVADLYNEPMNQTEQQLRLTIEALRERQEHEMLNNRDFGLLHNVDLSQRIPTRSGPPTPDDLDELLSLVWKEPAFLLAHPRTIAAIGREFNSRGLYPGAVDFNGQQVPSWRGVPIFPCNKIPITEQRTSSILVARTGMDNQGVIGLYQTGLPDEYQPGLSVRFMNISEKAILSYLVSTYYSAAVLVPDALAMLEDVEIGREG